MEIYLVGGAVRDRLLGLPVKDRDWVVVGATPSEMEAAGYKTVGKDFPVFLHPDTGEEYALARTERKSGQGHTAFTFHASPDITLEQDLERRDLTVNAIAQSPSGELIDPFGGQDDLASRTLRHVSPAFREDPLRVLRTARFAARFAALGFQVAPETLELMQAIAEDGELEHLTPERIWQEFERALSTAHVTVFIDVLNKAHASERVLPELRALPPDTPSIMARMSTTCQPEQRFAVLCVLAFDNSAQPQADIRQLCQRLRCPNRYRDLALWLQSTHPTLAQFGHARPMAQYTLIRELDLLRKPERLDLLRPCVQALYQSEHVIAPQLEALLDNMRAIDPKQLMAEGFKGKALGEEISRRQLQICQQFSA
ncbi:CCA tRNA nucleotidyltransferase [Marinobacterium litorale]|uniref:CCA tRNA nucleotidyltransferase n=1 Tax=Marinobacterium litorale TaxID=404770 RepID=UPI0004111F67|nr:CCA tRNA nucleotidyltransferase [Marinobacterium litorale]